MTIVDAALFGVFLFFSTGCGSELMLLYLVFSCFLVLAAEAMAVLFFSIVAKFFLC